MTKANLYFILAAVSWPLLTITSSKSTKIKAIVFSFYMYIITTILSFIITDFNSGNIFEFNMIFWINLINISVVSTTFATSIYFIAVSKLGTNEASSFIFLVPFNVIILSNIFLDEPVYFTTIIGTILTILAVSMLNNVKLPKFLHKIIRDI
jgi:drug/metabolite transporter (DMT)-like permease